MCHEESKPHKSTALSAVTEITGGNGHAEHARRPKHLLACAGARCPGQHSYLPIEYSERAQLLQAHRAVGLSVVGHPRVGRGLVHVPSLHHGGGGFHKLRWMGRGWAEPEPLWALPWWAGRGEGRRKGCVEGGATRVKSRTSRVPWAGHHHLLEHQLSWHPQSVL